MRGLLTSTLFFVALIGSFNFTGAITLSSYGDKCDTTIPCNAKSTLTCRDGTCQCPYPDTMVFSEEVQKCVVLLGEKCVYKVDEYKCGNETMEVKPAWNGTLSCETNSVCNNNGICVCSFTSYQTLNKSCITKGWQGDSCKSNLECRSDQNFICHQGKCICNYDYFTYDNILNRCVFRVGKGCDSSNACPPYAVCLKALHLYENYERPPYYFEDGYPSYESYVEAWKQFEWKSLKGSPTNRYRLPGYYSSLNLHCVCFGGYYQTLNGTCEPVKFLGETCSYDLQCQPDLRCYDGTCQCERTTSELHKEYNICVKKVGKRCAPIRHTPCVPHAVCKPTGSQFRDPANIRWNEFRCTCDSTHFESFNGTCELKKGFGEVCRRSEECQSEGKDFKLVCLPSGVCGCALGTNYDDFLHICRVQPGYSCGQGGERECVENAICTNETSFKCSCFPGHYKSAEGTCEPKRVYGELCQSNVQCDDEVAKLVCQNGSCDCDVNSDYDEREFVCRVRVGHPCTRNRRCVAGAVCSELGMCKYEDEYALEKARTRYEQSCDETHRFCNSSTGMICRDGVCACRYRNHQKFDPILKKCVSLVGGPCGEEGLDCTRNADCITSPDDPSRKKCECRDGYNPSQRECYLSHGASCSIEGQHSLDGKCDTLANLHCFNGTCSCDEFEFYDKEKLKCRGLVGASCIAADANNRFCGDGAFCEIFRGNEVNKKGVCTCLPGFRFEGEQSICLSTN